MHDILDLSETTARRWDIINDGVMGGRSTSDVERSDGTLRFTGHVSLENNGGFASTRTDLEPVDLSAFDGVALRVRGDGRRYQFRLRMRPRDRIAYKAEFHTRPDEWIEVRIPFDDFRPTFRGRRPRDAPPLDPSTLGQLGFLIADKRAGPFTLQVERIAAYRGDTAHA
jgi:monofunctional biosynthetic peptidoglycan transglycosylase